MTEIRDDTLLDFITQLEKGRLYQKDLTDCIIQEVKRRIIILERQDRLTTIEECCAAVGRKLPQALALEIQSDLRGLI